MDWMISVVFSYLDYPTILKMSCQLCTNLAPPSALPHVLGSCQSLLCFAFSSLLQPTEPLPDHQQCWIMPISPFRSLHVLPLLPEGQWYCESSAYHSEQHYTKHLFTAPHYRRVVKLSFVSLPFPSRGKGIVLLDCLTNYRMSLPSFQCCFLVNAHGFMGLKVPFSVPVQSPCRLLAE